jgi:tape measure domain-containing protein
MATVRELVTKWSFDVNDKPLRRMEADISRVKKLAFGAGIAITAISAAVGVLLNQAGKFEQWRIAFETMLGGAEKASNLLEDIKKFALETPFVLPEIIQGARQLLAFGIESDKIIESLKILGDVASGVSQPISRLILNFGQVKAQAKLTGRELRDFAVLGVPLIAELAKILNVAESEIQSLVSRGKIGFKLVNQAFINMTESGGRFANLMIRQSKSLFGIISNVNDVIIQLSIGLGDRILPEAKRLTKQFLDFLQVNRKIILLRSERFVIILVKFVKQLLGIVKGLLISMKVFVTILGGAESAVKKITTAFAAFFALNILSLIGSTTQSILLLTKAIFHLGNTALLAKAKILLIPIAIGAIMAGIALIIEDIIAFTQGRKSVLGVILEFIEERIPAALKKMITESLPFIKILKQISNIAIKISDTFSDIVNSISQLISAEFKPFFDLISKIAGISAPKIQESGKVSAEKAIPSIAKGGISDVLQSFNPLSLAGAVTPAFAGINKEVSKRDIRNNFSVNAPITVQVDGQAPEDIGEQVRSGVSEALRETFNATRNIIEDEGQ